MIDMKLTRQYFDVKELCFGDKSSLKDGVLRFERKGKFKKQASVYPVED